MRLLHTTTYELKTFIGGSIPQYAILSHTWGEDEFVFENLKVPIVEQLHNPKRGLIKVLQTCALALKDGLDYAWIDTCCIDKSSSAELSEAINSMFRWYRKASMCYVWLEDVTLDEEDAGECYGFEASKWFRRGWTLQELIAPHDVIFYDSNWDPIDNRYSLAERISSITKIKVEALRRRHLRFDERTTLNRMNADTCPGCYSSDPLEAHLWETPIAVRMSWAKGRQTTRAEDRAYCLLGLFDVNMPLLYGEGNKAFKRLLNEMLQNEADSSILLWQKRKDFDSMSCLPISLEAGDFSVDIPLHRNPRWPQPEIVLAPRGLSVAAWLAPCSALNWNREFEEMTKDWQLAVLSPTAGEDMFTAVGIFVKPISFFGEVETIYTRVARYTIVIVEKDSYGGYARASFRLRHVVEPGDSLIGGFLSMTTHPEQKAYINPTDFQMNRITLSLTESTSSQRRGAAIMRIDARHCGPYHVHDIYPPVKNLGQQETSTLHFENNAHAAEAVILAFIDQDLSSGFFVLWRNGDSAEDGITAVTSWPTLESTYPTPAHNKHDLEDSAWLRRKQDQLKRNLDPFSTLPALKTENGMSRNIYLLPELQVRVMVVPQSFMGIERFVLVVEVGSEVPETAPLWEKRGVKIKLDGGVILSSNFFRE